MNRLLASYLLICILFMNIPSEVIHKHEHEEKCELKQTNVDVSSFIIEGKIHHQPVSQHFHEEEYDCELCQILSKYKLIQFAHLTDEYTLINHLFFKDNLPTNKVVNLYTCAIPNKGSPLKVS